MAKNDQPTPGQQDGGAESDNGFFGSEGPFATLLRYVDPRMMAEQGVALSKTMLDIVTGKSDIAPDARDWRFKDEAWTKNPAYKRLAQAYLAATESVEKMIPAPVPGKGRFAKPVEYQDSRGFVLHAEMMIEGVAVDLSRSNPAASTKAIPSPMISKPTTAMRPASRKSAST